MEAQGGAGSPEPNKDIQKLLKSSSSGDLSREFFHHPAGEEEGGLSGHTASLLHITEKRQPLSSVSSLEVHFDLLDLTELTDMSDQELAEVFADSDEENHESPVPISLCCPEVGTHAPPRGHAAEKLSPHVKESTTATRTPQSP
ncbi:dysbindin domain-containing protein 1 isoform X2 [Sander lucioperca]|uniref:dysbindin domain-containing protein 1 isoform X2 n=1 Tax=Sander lucioperca TaxID=283035 RepID=UPI00125D885F|nr:dysbindin domain-containing protein 1 isoform X2 [Sander lucioperca]